MPSDGSRGAGRPRSSRLRRAGHRSRYGRYSGGPDPLAPPVDLRRVEEIGETIAHRWLYQRGRENLGDLLPDAPRLPVVIDRDLLVEAEGELGTTLRGSEEARRKLRDGFWARLYREFTSEGSTAAGGSAQP